MGFFPPQHTIRITREVVFHILQKDSDETKKRTRGESEPKNDKSGVEASPENRVEMNGEDRSEGMFELAGYKARDGGSRTVVGSL